MILSPEIVRRFRSVVKKCLVSKSQTPSLRVLIQSDGKTLSLLSHLGEVSVKLQLPHLTSKQRLSLPLSFLQTLESAGREPVEITLRSATEGVARWNQLGIAVEHPFPILPIEKQKVLPLPSPWVSMPPHFLTALHDAGRTAGREPTKFALNRIQLRGKSGSVIASDSKQALIQSGFPLPFTEDLYLPALPVFGVKEFHGESQIGRTPNHLAIQNGEWTVWLLLDSQARYPDVEHVIPRCSAPTRLEFSDADANWILDRAKEITTDDSESALTFDIAPQKILLRMQSENRGGLEVQLTSTSVSGPPVKFVLDPTYLERLLLLGFRSVQIAGPNKPLVAKDANRTYLIMVLDPVSLIPSNSNLKRITTGEVPLIRPPVPLEQSIMKPDPTPHSDPPEEEALDPLTEAMALKSALWEAAQRAARLLAALKTRKKEQRALNQVFSSLKALNLGGRGEP